MKNGSSLIFKINNVTRNILNQKNRNKLKIYEINYFET